MTESVGDDRSRNAFEFIKGVGLRLAIWLGVCTAAAAPSFSIALNEGFDAGGMVAGVLCFVVGYTVLTSTRRFKSRFKLDAAFRRSVYVAYGLRCGIVIVSPAAQFIDLFPGFFSISVVAELGLERLGFVATMLTTIVQGSLLSLIVALFTVILYAALRLFLPRHRPELARGFAVIPVGSHSSLSADMTDGARRP